MPPGEPIPTELDVPAEAVEGRSPGHGIVAAGHQWNMRLVERIGGDQPLAPIHSITELQPQPLCQVTNRGADATGRRLCVWITLKFCDPRAVCLDVKCGAVGAGNKIGMA